MEKILISVGVVLSLAGVCLMIRSKLRRTPDGLADIVGGPIKKWLYRLGWIALVVGVMAQLVGIWSPHLFQVISSAFVSTPAVNSLTQSGTSLLDWLRQIQPIIYFLVALFTGFAAGAAWFSASNNRKATQSQLYIRLMEEYGSERMFNALRGIKKFSELKDIPPALAELRKILVEGRKLNDDKEQRQRYTFYSDTIRLELNKRDNFNSDRRVVKYYFLKLLRLHENNFLSKNLMQALGKVAGIDIFYDVIQPIEFAKEENFNVLNFKKIYEICGTYDEGGEKG